MTHKLDLGWGVVEMSDLEKPDPEDRLRAVLEGLFHKHGFGISEIASIHAALEAVVRETANLVSRRFGTPRISNNIGGRDSVLRHWGLKEKP